MDENTPNLMKEIDKIRGLSINCYNYETTMPQLADLKLHGPIIIKRQTTWNKK